MNVGCHMDNKGNMIQLITSAPTIGANAAQIYLSSRQAWSRGRRISLRESTESKELMSVTGLKLVVHGKLIYNFSREAVGSWSRQIDVLVDELRQASLLGADVIIHQGKGLDMTPTESKKNFVTNLVSVLEKVSDLNNKLVLENSCQQGTELGYTLDGLCELDEMFPENLRKSRIRYCLDLCHVFVSGELDMRRGDDVEMWLKRFDERIGLDRLSVVHFNDSAEVFDAHNDHHGDLMAGFIGNPLLGGSSDGFRKLISILKSREIPLILETPGDYVAIEDQIRLVRSWVDGDDEYEKLYMKTHEHFISKAQKDNYPKMEKHLAKMRKRAKPITLKVNLKPVSNDPPVRKIKVIIKDRPHS